MFWQTIFLINFEKHGAKVHKKVTGLSSSYRVAKGSLCLIVVCRDVEEDSGMTDSKGTLY